MKTSNMVERDLTTFMRSRIRLKYDLFEDIYYTVFNVADHQNVLRSNHA